MKSTNYITILAWMGNLKLSLVEKTIFAIIYGFSQDEDSEFNGSRQYLAQWCEASTKTVDRALSHLVELGYIHKREKVVGGVKFCRYSVDVPTADKMSLPWTNWVNGRDILSKATDKMSNNNIDNNADTIVSANKEKENNAQSAHARTRKDKVKFDFVAALVALGVDAQTARDWADIRKSKGARNTQSEYDYVVREILNACERYELTAQECVAFAAGNSWRGFRASWDEVRNIKKNKNEDNRKGVGGQPYYTGDTI